MSEKRDSVNQKQTQTDLYYSFHLMFTQNPTFCHHLLSPTGHSKPYFLTKRELLRTVTPSIKKNLKKKLWQNQNNLG